MSNLKTIAWDRLGKIVGYGRQLIDYRSATTNSINRYIQVIKERRGLEMYNKSLKQKEEQDSSKILKLIIDKEIRKRKNKIKIYEDKCSICYDKFDLVNYTDILTLACKHTFHHSCIRNMIFIYMDDKCPLCRRVFKYKFNACHKIKLRIKNKILKHHTNKCNRMNILDLMKLALFLSEKDISCIWLINIIFHIRRIPPEDFLLIQYCELYNKHIYLYTTAYCGSNTHCIQHH